MPQSKTGISRRRFTQTAVSVGALTAGPAIVPGSALGLQGTTPPSDRIIMGGIGLGGRGRKVLGAFLPDKRVEFVAICDIREERRELVKSQVDKHYGTNKCEMVHDAGDLLARDDIEAVIIATSDRWHTLMSIWAAQSGKDIYCEKPAAMTIAECYALAENIKRYGAVFQAGTQRRNLPHFEYAVGLARSGKLGVLHTLHAHNWGRLVTPLGHSWWPPDKPEPDKRVFDWDKWLGPCGWRPYNSVYPDRGRGVFWDFHTGILEWGSHTVDLCQWAANCDDTQAIEHDPQGTTVNSVYANGLKLVERPDNWLDVGTCAVRFEGSEGWVETGDGGKIVLSDNLKSLHRDIGIPGTDPALHAKDFLDCVRSRSQPRANAEATANTHITCHGAYIACQLGRKVRWDPASRSFINDEEANRLRSRAYREPWRVDALATSA